MGALEFWRVALRRPAPDAVARPPAARRVEELRRRLDLIILAHLWVLAPLAPIWFAVPRWRDPGQEATAGLLTIALTAVGYLVVRTWLNLSRRAPGFNDLWPYIDVALVTAALVTVRNPNDALTILYLVPLTSAAATLNLRHIAALVAVTVAGYLLVIMVSAVAWSVGLIYRIVIIALMASLYGWVIRTVTGHERAMERAEFQRELAREIHDGIQHLLITLGKRLELAQPLILEAPARAVQIVEEERETARRAADELRYLVRRLRSGPTRHADLATALRLQVAALAERFPYAIDLVLPPALPRLQPAPEHALLRCIQESLTNVAKHARAAHVEVRLGVSEDALACTITDDGVGFDPAGTAGAGLEGLRERVRALGGVLEVRSAPGAGTTVTTRIPLRENTR